MAQRLTLSSKRPQIGLYRRKSFFLLTFSDPFKNSKILQKWRKIMDFRYNRTIRGGKILSSTITQQLLPRHKF